MSLQKTLRWNRLVAAVVLSVFFLVTGLAIFPGTAHAAATYVWEQRDGAYYIHVNNFDKPDNSGNRANFMMLCSGTFPRYTCDAPRNINTNTANGTDLRFRDAGHCPPRMTFNGDSSQGELQLYNTQRVNNAYVCTAVSPTTTVQVGDTKNAFADLPSKAPTGGDEALPDQELECGTKFTNISWYFCSLVNGLRDMVGTLDGLIYALLTVDADKIFSDTTESGKGFHSAWRTLMYLAVGLLIISALIMIIAHALGLEILDAYTIKKILPRLVIAIIGMALSWELMKFLVVFTNDLGLGIRDIMWSPFKDVPAEFAPGVGTSIIAFLIGLGGLAALGIVGLFMLVLTAVLSLLLAFLVLVLRQVIIVMLIVFAPIAIAASVLPNTRGVFKIWYEVFTKLLMMFPIIIAIITIGRIFAVTALGSGAADIGNVHFISQFIAYAAIVVTYFMILWAFQFAGKVGGALAGIANDRSRGIFDRLKKGRAARVADNTARMKAGTRFNNRAFNAATARATTKKFGFGKGGRAALEQKTTLAAQEYGKSAKGQSIMHNDRALQAMTYGSAAEADANMAKDFDIQGPGAQREVREAIAQARSAGGFGRANQVYAAQALSSTGTGYNNLEEVSRTIARASNGNPNSVAAMAGFINSDTKQRNRHDLAPGFSTLNKLAMDEVNKEPVINYGQARENAWGSASLYAHANDKPKNIENAIDYHKQLLTSTDDDQRLKAGVFFNELKAMQPNASGDVRGKIQKALDDDRDKIDELYMRGSATYLKDTDDVTVTVRDPTTGATSMRAETGKERVERKSRTYERPDPNVL